MTMMNYRLANLRMVGVSLGLVILTVVGALAQQGDFPSGIRLGSQCVFRTGTGTPEGVVTGSVCDVFLRTNGSTSTTLYVKESGTATNTGWVAVGAPGASLTVKEADGTPTVATVDTITVTNGTLTDSGSGDVILTTGGGGGGGAAANSVLVFAPASNEPPTAAFATLDTRNVHPTLDFDGATDEEAVFTGQLPSGYTGAGVTLNTYWAFTSATSGSLRVQAAFERIDASSLDIDADSFASFNSAGGTAPATSGQVIAVSVAFANGAEMDSTAAGETFRLKIRRDADGTSGTDDIATDAELVLAVLVIPDTGGNNTYTAAHGSEPSATSGDVTFPTNAPLVRRYSGSAWVNWGPIFPLTAPIDGDFAWVNQGGSTVSTTNGGIYLEAPLNASIGWRLRVKSAPAAPYTVTAMFSTWPLAVDFHAWGLCLRESGTSKITHFGIQTSTATSIPWLNVSNYTNETTFSAIPNQRRFYPGSVVHLRITDDNTNLLFYFSQDGQHWIGHTSAGRTSFMAGAPNQIGFCANPENGTYPVGVMLLSWKES